MKYYRDKLLEIFRNNGIFNENINENLVLDSITFVTLIVDCENAFDISFPDEDLVYQNDFSISDFEKKIMPLM